jgi:hypothetical protein
MNEKLRGRPLSVHALGRGNKTCSNAALCLDLTFQFSWICYDVNDAKIRSEGSSFCCH